jgi:putative DNA primase/helicase
VAKRADPKLRSQLRSRAKAGNVHAFAQIDQRTAATIDLWDRGPWLLNTPDGVINLRNGKMRRSKPGDYITKITAVSPEGDCPRFEKFLDEITDGNCALQGFLQRMAGYALTGVTRDHALFFLYGLGANGKSVFLNTLVGILGDYHRVAPTEMLLASKFDRHPTELAGLVGRRLATAVETGRVRHWAEEKIKAMTGGDKITARFMHHDFFDFIPAFKLIVVGNQKPNLYTVDVAMRRRFYLVPFTVTIPAEPISARSSRRSGRGFSTGRSTTASSGRSRASTRRRSSPRQPRNISTRKTRCATGSPSASTTPIPAPRPLPRSSTPLGRNGARSRASGRAPARPSARR